MVVVETELSIRHLSHNKPSNRHSSTEQGGRHQELEAVNDSLVVQTTCLGHGRQTRPLQADVAEDAPDHVAQKEEVDAGRDSSHDDEGQLVEEKGNNNCKPPSLQLDNSTHRKFRSCIGHPDGVERIPQLHSTFAHVEDEQCHTTNNDCTQVLPVDLQRVLLATVLDQHVFAGKDQPEGEESGVEHALTDVAQQQHEWHVKVDGQVLQGH